MMMDRMAKAGILAAALVVFTFGGFATDRAAAGYPDRIVRIVVPFAPGGGTDVIARALAQEMARDLGGSVIIENRPGAGTINRNPIRRDQCTRWLHAADGHLRQRGQSEPECEAAL